MNSVRAVTENVTSRSVVIAVQTYRGAGRELSPQEGLVAATDESSDKGCSARQDEG